MHESQTSTETENIKPKVIAQFTRKRSIMLHKNELDVLLYLGFFSKTNLQ